MLARSNGGFTTCLVLRADADGALTIANAGHIPPYLGGKELQFESGLPLGISADTVYAESTFQLSPEQQLTLLTDGVVEARDKSGTLFGFERSASLSTQPAEAIAQCSPSLRPGRRHHRPLRNPHACNPHTLTRVETTRILSWHSSGRGLNLLVAHFAAYPPEFQKKHPPQRRQSYS